MFYSKITGTGSYLPETILTNQELEKMVETSDEWIMKRVGIRERHIVSGTPDTTCTMAVAAAKKAIAEAGIAPNAIDLIIVGTASADYYLPSVACVVQNELGIANECPAFDVNAACAGFIYGMSIVDQYIRTGAAKCALIIGVDTLSRILDWSDRATCVLFGDGAGAAILQAAETPGVIATKIHAAGKHSMLLYAHSHVWQEGEKVGKVQMSGNEVFKQAVTKLGDIVDEVLEKAGLDKSYIDWLVPHQANTRIIQATAKRLGLPMEQVIVTVERHGNTSAASVPLALDEAIRTGMIQRGQNILLEAFGAGLSWGAALLKY